MEYRGYTIYSSAGDFMPIKVVFTTHNGTISDPKSFRSVESAKEWIDWVADMEGTE